ncbi:hypothetical protein L3V82_03950 [Thiotrichales bacterium 19S3-7]|nr:hypothetical protein [Thiotrichales bacterium 19S3-7]MCF6801827.1 hypothetical protein [Thiotrichales bacterium 19S3-11]
MSITVTEDKAPVALFDKHEFMKAKIQEYRFINFTNAACREEYILAREFICQKAKQIGTFTSYRREIEKFLQWAWLIKKSTINKLTGADLEEYISFCKAPPKSWMSYKKSPRFITIENLRIPNPQWRPFIVENSNKKNYKIKDSSLKGGILILSSFYNYLLEKQYIKTNPILLLSKNFNESHQTKPVNKRKQINKLQWQYMIKAIEESHDNKTLKERDYFIITLLYNLKLKLQELLPLNGDSPLMKHFYKEANQWYFITNKQRVIQVDEQTLDALANWRKFLGFKSIFPSLDDKTPLLISYRGGKSLTTETHIRRVINQVFVNASKLLIRDGYNQESQKLTKATVTWLY